MYVYAFQAGSSGDHTQVVLAFFDPANDNRVNIIWALNPWPTAAELNVVHQYDSADLARPDEGYDQPVTVLGPVPVGAGEYAEVTVSSLGLKIVDNPDFYGDTALVADGTGTLPVGGEVIPGLTN